MTWKVVSYVWMFKIKCIHFEVSNSLTTPTSLWPSPWNLYIILYSLFTQSCIFIRYFGGDLIQGDVELTVHKPIKSRGGVKFVFTAEESSNLYILYPPILLSFHFLSFLLSFLFPPLDCLAHSYPYSRLLSNVTTAYWVASKHTNSEKHLFEAFRYSIPPLCLHLLYLPFPIHFLL